MAKIASKSTIIASTAIINTYFRKILRQAYKIMEKSNPGKTG